MAAAAYQSYEDAVDAGGHLWPAQHNDRDKVAHKAQKANTDEQNSRNCFYLFLKILITSGYLHFTPCSIRFNHSTNYLLQISRSIKFKCFFLKTKLIHICQGIYYKPQLM